MIIIKKHSVLLKGWSVEMPNASYTKTVTHKPKTIDNDKILTA